MEDNLEESPVQVEVNVIPEGVTVVNAGVFAALTLVLGILTGHFILPPVTKDFATERAAVEVEQLKLQQGVQQRISALQEAVISHCVAAKMIPINTANGIDCKLMPTSPK